MGQVHYNWRVLTVQDLVRRAGLILLATPADPPVRVEQHTIGGSLRPVEAPASPGVPPPPPPENPVKYSIEYDRFQVLESLTPRGRDRIGTTIEVPSASNDQRRTQAQDWARGRVSNHPIFERFKLEPTKATTGEEPAPKRRRGKKRRRAQAEAAEAEADPIGPRIIFLHERPAPHWSIEGGDVRASALEYAFGNLSLPISRRAEIEAVLRPPEGGIWSRLIRLWRG